MEASLVRNAFLSSIEGNPLDPQFPSAVADFLLSGAIFGQRFGGVGLLLVAYSEDAPGTSDVSFAGHISTQGENTKAP